MSGVGKDSDYFGGELLRSIDKGLQKIGVDRNSAFMKECHKLEHERRAKIAEQQGDQKRAEAERKRAESNRNNQKQQNTQNDHQNQNHSNKK